MSNFQNVRGSSIVKSSQSKGEKIGEYLGLSVVILGVILYLFFGWKRN